MPHNPQTPEEFAKVTEEAMKAKEEAEKVDEKKDATPSQEGKPVKGGSDGKAKD